MEITIFAGKGGVGKSTLAAAYALSKSKTGKTLLVDYDGGHSLARVLAMNKEFAANKICGTDIENLLLALVECLQFTPISKAKENKIEDDEYLAQFVGDYGLIPFCDMVTTFFGVPTDIPTVSKFLALTVLCHDALDKRIRSLVLDIEPTAGLQRLLNNTEVIARSLCNLSEIGFWTLEVLGAKWPDIAVFLKSGYIHDVELYMDRAQEMVKLLKSARYILVSVPENSPVAQMEDIEKLIMSFGAKIAGYVVNNIRQEAHEKVQIENVLAKAGDKPVILIEHDEDLCDSGQRARRDALLKVGGKI